MPDAGQRRPDINAGDIRRGSVEKIIRLIVRREQRFHLAPHRGVVGTRVGEKARTLGGGPRRGLAKQLLDPQPAVPGRFQGQSYRKFSTSMISERLYALCV